MIVIIFKQNKHFSRLVFMQLSQIIHLSVVSYISRCVTLLRGLWMVHSNSWPPKDLFLFFAPLIASERYLGCCSHNGRKKRLEPLLPCRIAKLLKQPDPVLNTRQMLDKSYYSKYPYIDFISNSICNWRNLRFEAG